MSTDRPTPELRSPDEVRGTGVPEVDALLAEDREAITLLPKPAFDDLFDEIEAETVGKRPGLRDRLRELGTPVRIVLVLLVMAGGSASFLGLVGARGDLSSAEGLWLGALQVLLLVGSVSAVAMSLRPLSRPGLGVLAWVGAGAALLAPVLLSLVPGLWPGYTHAAPMIGHFICGVGGMIVAAPVAVAVLVLDRGDRPSPWRVLLAAGSAGLLAYGVGHWHCPMVHPTHLILAHASHGVLIGGAVLLLTRFWPKRRRR